MKNQKWIAAVAVLILAAFTACGGSDSGVTSSGNLTNDGKAGATAVQGICGSVSDTTAANTGGGVASSSYNEMPASVRQGISSYITRRAIEEIIAKGKAGVDKTVSITGSNPFTVAFSNEVVDNPLGGGTATIDGSFTLTMTEDGNNYIYTADGNIAADVSEWEAAVTASDTTYNLTVSGSWTMTMGGTLTITFDITDLNNWTAAVTSALTTTIAGENISYTGDAAGTASMTAFTVTVGGTYIVRSVSSTISIENNLTVACSGSVTVTPQGGELQTCAVVSTCDSCQ